MKKLFWPFIFLYYIFLYWYGVHFLSFSIFEAKSLEEFKLLGFLFDFVTNLKKSDYIIRLIPLTFSFFSLILFYEVSKFYLIKLKNKYYASLIFIFIPGFIISSLILNKSIILIFLTLLFIFAHKKARFISYLLLISYAFVDYSFVALYFSLIFYALYKKDNKLFILVLALLALNANYFGYKIDGKPKGFLLDILGTYSLIFSPFVFIYFLYSFYKSFFIKKDILFFIGAFSFLISLLLSFRQRIRIDDFAPFVLPYVIYMIKIFFHSYRVRLPKFRINYKILFIFLFSSMIIFDIGIFFFNAPYVKRIRSSFYFIKPLSKILKQNKINYIKCNNSYLCKALNFYGIKKGNKYILYFSKRNFCVSIIHNKKIIKIINVSKINTL